MFVIELTYKAELTEIDAHMTAHVKFLKKYYASGHFLVSGRKIPRDGGIILSLTQQLLPSAALTLRVPPVRRFVISVDELLREALFGNPVSA